MLLQQILVPKWVPVSAAQHNTFPSGRLLFLDPGLADLLPWHGTLPRLGLC